MPTKIATIGACLFLLASPSFSEELFHTRPSCWQEPRIHSAPDLHPEPDLLRISGSLETAVLSPNGAYGFAMRETEGDAENPRRAIVEISVERPYLLQAAMPNARSVEPPKWVNEKLLYLRVWWGRVAGTDYLLDVEAERFVLGEGFNYGGIAYQQFQQCKEPEWKDTETCACFPEAPPGWRPTPLIDHQQE